MTITDFSPLVTHRVVLVRSGTDEPFDEADVRRALQEVRPVLTMAGQRNMTRRWITPFGSVYIHLMLGPPTWWLPRVRLRSELMVGWLRAAVAVAVRRGSRS